MAKDKKIEVKQIPLTGKLITSVDPSTIGENFQSLKNLRYADTHLRGIQGMSKINSTVMPSSYTKPVSGIYYKKNLPVANGIIGLQPESHVLLQSSDGSNTAILQNTTAPPSTGDFSATVVADASGASVGRFSKAPGDNVVYCNKVESKIWGGDETNVGVVFNTDLDGVTFINDHTDALINSKSVSPDVMSILQDTSTANQVVLHIGTTRPVDAFNIYMGATVNTGTAAAADPPLTVEYFSGTAWVAVSSLVDGTATGADPNLVSLGQTGRITFDNTDGLVKTGWQQGVNLYYYRLTFKNVDAAVLVAQITCTTPWQSIKAVWSGEFDPLIRGAFTVGTGLAEFTLPLVELDFVPITGVIHTNTYVTWAGTDIAYFGFVDRQQAIDVTLVTTSINDAVATMTVEYWNGSSWTSVSNPVDGTLDSGKTKTFAQSGMVTWTPAASDAEFRVDLGGGTQLYYYRFTPSGAFSPAVIIDKIAGVAVNKTVGNYKFPIFGTDRAILCNDTEGVSNSVLVSASNTPDVWQGSDTAEFFFGETGALVAGESLYGQFGSSIYRMLVVCKDDETYILIMSGAISDWILLEVSDTIGCNAPLTMKTVNITLSQEKATVNKQFVIWQGIGGVYLFDGRAPVEVSKDISELFDPSSGNALTPSLVEESVGFVDIERQEYHWLCATGTGTTTLNREFVYDLKRQKWFELDRSSGKKLQIGLRVSDTSGNEYTYGAADTGFMFRLEDGNTLDGADIDFELHTGDLLLSENLFERTNIRVARLVNVAKNTTTSTVAGAIFKDGATTAVDDDTFTLDPSSVNRVATSKVGLNSQALFHSIKMSTSTSNETYGFEPVYIGLLFNTHRLDYN